MSNLMIKEMLSAYYVDMDPDRLLVIADALDDFGVQELPPFIDAEIIPQQGVSAPRSWPDALRQCSINCFHQMYNMWVVRAPFHVPDGWNVAYGGRAEAERRLAEAVKRILFIGCESVHEVTVSR